MYNKYTILNTVITKQGMTELRSNMTINSYTNKLSWTITKKMFFISTQKNPMPQRTYNIMNISTQNNTGKDARDKRINRIEDTETGLVGKRTKFFQTVLSKGSYFGYIPNTTYS